MIDRILKPEERAVLRLRELYQSYGYTGFRMSKFEEYDLYADNRDFLVSDRVITFTDTDGKLMALKPDVTLSIVKQADAAGGVRRVYYDEHVYRISERTQQYKELMQTGVECIGALGVHQLCEVVALAGQSLTLIAEQSVLTLSHLAILDALLPPDCTAAAKKNILTALAAKNPHDMKLACTRAAMTAAQIDALVALTDLYGSPADVLPRLRALCADETVEAALTLLSRVVQLCEQMGVRVVLDMSLVSDSGYYNGLVFRGYVRGIPTAVLFGGQYDRLLRRMGKQAGAIGFAVYLDELQLLHDDTEQIPDVRVVCTDAEDVGAVYRYVHSLTEQGLRVVVDTQDDGRIRATNTVVFSGGEGHV